MRADSGLMGSGRDRRGLKHRAEGKFAGCPVRPRSTRLLREHLTRFAGRARPARLPWRPGQPAGDDHLPAGVGQGAAERADRARVPARRSRGGPYDLRHACLSTWLNGGVAPTQVAEWAGHSVEMLLRVCAKCLDGQDEIARQGIIAALNDSHQA